jgi:hypothetical protein
MTPGTLIIDNEFVYSNGETGKKILVILNDGSTGYYIVIKTTSKDTYKGIKFGCQSDDRYPNFFLPKGCCYLRMNTWVMLDQFFEFSAQEVLAKHFSGKMNQLAVLPDNIIKGLLECAANCQDITVAQEKVVRDTLRMLDGQN